MFVRAYVGYPIYKHFGAMRALDPLQHSAIFVFGTFCEDGFNYYF